MNRVGVHAVVGELPDLGAVIGRGDGRHVHAGWQFDAVKHLVRRVGIPVQNHVLQACLGVGRFHPQEAAHASVLQLEGFAHLILDHLGLEVHGEPICGRRGDVWWARCGCRIRIHEPVEGERCIVDLNQPRQGSVALERGAVGAVVCTLSDDDRVLPLLEHALAAQAGGLEGRLERRQVEALASTGIHLDLHDGTRSWVRSHGQR